jgi:hypothetical protein
VSANIGVQGCLGSFKQFSLSVLKNNKEVQCALLPSLACLRKAIVVCSFVCWVLLSLNVQWRVFAVLLACARHLLH